VEEVKRAPPGGKLLPGNGLWIELGTTNYAGTGHPRILVATQVRGAGGARGVQGLGPGAGALGAGGARPRTRRGRLQPCQLAAPATTTPNPPPPRATQISEPSWSFASPPFLLKRPVTKGRQVESLSWLRQHYRCAGGWGL
jgi:hypothetical protein